MSRLCPQTKYRRTIDEYLFVIPPRTNGKATQQVSREVFLKSEFLIVAQRLMETEKRAMSPRELVDLAQKHRLFSDNIAGKTRIKQ